MIRVKAHFRHMNNGQLVHVVEHSDKRNRALQQPASFKGKVVHADATATSVVNHKGELQTFPHTGEMSRDAMHAHLNKPLPVNADLAHHVIKHQLGIQDHGQFLKDAVEEEGYKSKPRFQDVKGAAEWFHDTHIAPKLKELREAHGKTTTRAKAYQHKHKDLRDMWNAHAEDEDAHHHQQAEGKMLKEHGEAAHAQEELALEQGAKAQAATAAQAPKVAALSPKIKAYGHQAQALAQMNVAERSICDVDMGGGKGFILPADALALMGQGKVKRPLVVVPGPTLDQNAAKITDEYTGGKVNVLKISTESVAKHFGGDISKAVEAIKAAPPNTIVMASYDVIAHQDKTGGPERFPHAAALGAAGIDYLSMDEVHNVRNEDSARFQAMTHLANTKYRRAASGTFLANDPRDVAGPLKLLYPSQDLDAKKLEQFYGRREKDDAAVWSPQGLKKLREHLLGLGMVSMRKSAWLDALPKRTEKLSVIQMLPEQRRIHDAVLEDALDRLETEAKDNPLLARSLKDDSLDNAWEAHPGLMAKMELMQGVTDYPDEMARMVEGKLALAGKGDAEGAEALAELQKMSPAARNAMLGLKGMVSPKAVDVYEKAKKHLGNKANGKFIVFVQRKAAAEHIMRHMPDELKAHGAMYFDASKMDELPSFTDHDDGPRMLVAVDASVKEGVNMQRANGLYRYDHHLTPGNQQQSYCRVDRLGQTRPVDIHMGIMDGGMDVTKYARLCSKGWVNQQVVSDFESDKSTPIFKLSVDNLREQRDASILNDYQALNDEIGDWQKGDAKQYKAKFGDKPYDVAGGDIKGSQPASHPAYHKPKQLKKSYSHWDDATPDQVARLLVSADGIIKARPRNWRYKQPAHIGSEHDKVGAKITNLADGKRERVAEIVQESIAAKDSPELLARRLRHSVNSGGTTGDTRDWERVARTEVANARAHAALDHIIDEYGKDALVVRETYKCCAVCCNAFGKYVRRKWKASAVPAKYAGAVHPNCKCGPWKLVNPLKRRALAKATIMRAEMPMGIVRRTPVPDGWDFAISTGYGRGTWAALDSMTGRAVMRAVLSHTPLISIDGADGYSWARVGHGRPTGRLVMLLDPLRTSGALYFAARPDKDDGPQSIIRAKTREQYVDAMLQTLPVVATMPEPWAGAAADKAALLPLTDFLGQKTLTDWWVRLPKRQPPEVVLATEPTGAVAARELVRRWNKALLNSDGMAKG